MLVENLEFTRDNSIPNLDEQHWTGTTQMLSGKTPTAYGDKARNATIDQYLGAKIGAGMPHPSLYMSLFAAMTCSFQADQSRVMPNNDPLDVFKKVFGGLSTTAPDAAVLRRLARRQSVLDSVAKDVAEAQLAAKMKGSRCTNPIIDPTLKYSDPMNLPATMRAFIDITVAAMACDQTRVVLISNFPSDNSYDYSCPYAPVNAPDAAHHALSHGGTNTNPDQSANQNGWLLERQFQHQMMAELAKKLKDIPEGTGTMLDNTVILIPSEVGGPHTHSPAGLQWTTVGGKNLGIKTGQYRRVAPSPGSYATLSTGVPTQRLHVALLQATGLPDQTFGEELESGSGPLPGYLA